MSIPKQSKYLIIGAGIHGLSTAWHLARELRARGHGGGQDILVIDKTGLGAGASGIACGVIRNNYFQPAMRELMVHSVEVWESEAQTLAYHPVGYIQLAPEAMREDVALIAQQQRDLGYESRFVEGEKHCFSYMKALFQDWRAAGLQCLLHEKRGGYANNMRSIQGLAGLAEAEGVSILAGPRVTAIRRDASGAVTGVDTDQGLIDCDYLIAAPGPWAKSIWEMLDLPPRATLRETPGGPPREVPMWVYWCLQEGTLDVEPGSFTTNKGEEPPVLHVDSSASIYSERDGSLLQEAFWGIYYKPDFGVGGVQGGTSPYRIETDPDQVRVDPYGPNSSEYVVGEKFAEMWVSALAHCHERFAGTLARYREEPSGGIGAFSPDNFPIFDVFRENCYLIADSNHGYKMVGVGKLVAEEILGAESHLLKPFRFARFAEGRLHPVSNSPFPWS